MQRSDDFRILGSGLQKFSLPAHMPFGGFRVVGSDHASGQRNIRQILAKGMGQRVGQVGTTRQRELLSAGGRRLGLAR